VSVPNLKRVALFGQKLLGSHKFEIGSRDPDHAHLGVVLYSLRRRGPSSISVPNLKRIAQFVQKLLRGSRN